MPRETLDNKEFQLIVSMIGWQPGLNLIWPVLNRFFYTRIDYTVLEQSHVVV